MNRICRQHAAQIASWLPSGVRQFRHSGGTMRSTVARANRPSPAAMLRDRGTGATGSISSLRPPGIGFTHPSQRSRHIDPARTDRQARNRDRNRDRDRDRDRPQKQRQCQAISSCFQTLSSMQKNRRRHSSYTQPFQNLPQKNKMGIYKNKKCSYGAHIMILCVALRVHVMRRSWGMCLSLVACSILAGSMVRLPRSVASTAAPVAAAPAEADLKRAATADKDRTTPAIWRADRWQPDQRQPRSNTRPRYPDTYRSDGYRRYAAPAPYQRYYWQAPRRRQYQRYDHLTPDHDWSQPRQRRWYVPDRRSRDRSRSWDRRRYRANDRSRIIQAVDTSR